MCIYVDMLICVYVCMCVYMCIYMHEYISICKTIASIVAIYTHSTVATNYTHTHIHTYTHTHAHTFLSSRSACFHYTCMGSCIRMSIHVHRVPPHRERERTRAGHVTMCTCAYIVCHYSPHYACACRGVCVHTYTRIHTCTRTCMRV